jgi:S1-C subfamily serine protease
MNLERLIAHGPVGVFMAILIAVLPALAAERVPAPAPSGWLGFGFKHTATRGTTAGWLYVTRVEPSGPARAAGLDVQDVITKINGSPLRFRNDLEVLQFFSRLHPGDVVRFTVVKGHAVRNVTIHVGVAPADLAKRWDDNYALAGRPKPHGQ